MLSSKVRSTRVQNQEADYQAEAAGEEVGNVSDRTSGTLNKNQQARAPKIAKRMGGERSETGVRSPQTLQ